MDHFIGNNKFIYLTFSSFFRTFCKRSFCLEIFPSFTDIVYAKLKILNFKVMLWWCRSLLAGDTDYTTHLSNIHTLFFPTTYTR